MLSGVDCPYSEDSSHIPSDCPVCVVPSPPSSSPPRGRSLGLSLSSSSSYNQPLPVATVPKTELRSYRITHHGLVATMGAFLDKPKTSKESVNGEGKGIRYAMSTMQGWRVDMEDAHVAQLSMSPSGALSDWSFFAVFDGHAGSIAAEFAASNVLQTLIETEEFKQVEEVLKREERKELCEKTQKLLEEGLKKGFLALDEKIKERLDSGKDRSGTTAVCAIVTPSHIVIANLGDSRAVFSRRGDNSFGTEDHKPNLDKERQRIINAGGSVMIQRINGSLAVSRALGDFEYKTNAGLSPCRQQVSAEPDVYFIQREQSRDEYLVLACDGIYDVMANDEMCFFVHSRLNVHSELTKVCNQMLDACLAKGSRDNMTFLLACFEGAPTVVEERVAEEKKTLDAIKAALAEIVEETIKNGDKRDEVCVEYVLRQLLNTRPEVIPVDGPLRLLTRSVAESVINELCRERGVSPTPSSPSSPHPPDSDPSSGGIAA